MNLIKQQSEQAARLADNSELLLKYRESVDRFLDPQETANKIEELDRQLKTKLSKLSKSSPTYAEDKEKIEAEVAKARFKIMKKQNSSTEQKKKRYKK